MATFHFTITLAGSGSDEASAWVDACESFALDPGVYDPEGCEKVEDDNPKQIIVEVLGGVAHCDDPRVKIIDHD